MSASRARRLAAPMVAAVALLVSACDPIPHSVHTVVESPSAPVAFRLLSGDGRFAVVEAFGPSTTVPGAGWWRVERATGTSVQLPTGATAISRDGSRVLLTDGGLWVDGTEVAPPAGARFSPDLTYAVFVDPADGLVRTWETATGAVGDVETGFPRPAGTTAGPIAVSDDGRVVHYAIGVIQRFVDLDAGTKVDLARAGGDVTEQFLLSADGDSVLHTYNLTMGNLDCMCTVVVESWAELVALPSGTPGARWHNTSDESIRAATISGNGDTGWVYRLKEEYRRDDCFGNPTPIGFSCAVSASVVAVGHRSHVPFGNVGLRLGSMDATPDGRFLAIDTFQAPLEVIPVRGPASVLDRYSDLRIDRLDERQTYTETDSFACRWFNWLNGSTPCTGQGWSSGGQISDDGTLVATTTTSGRGWYEYTPPPPAP